MKVRNGFISNSSSSSFILSTPKNVKDLTVTFKVEFGKKFETLGEWRKYIERRYGYYKHNILEAICEYDEEADKLYKKGKYALKNGDSIMVFSFSSEDDNPLSQLFYNDPSALIEAAEKAGCVILIDG